MRKFIIAAAVMAAFSCPARAGSYQAPRFDRPPPINMIDVDGVGDAIARQYIERRGWCDQPHAAPQPGQIVVWYERDRRGECVARAARG